MLDQAGSGHGTAKGLFWRW